LVHADQGKFAARRPVIDGVDRVDRLELHRPSAGEWI
jgi:hypothetical protein